MKKSLVMYVFLILLMACKQNVLRQEYRVETKDSANFSIMLPEVLPNERMIIRLNEELIEDVKGEDSIGTPGSWRYYKYPHKIVNVKFTDYYLGKEKIGKEFKDTLVDILQRTLIISRPFPKGVTKSNWHPYGFVSIDTGMRSIRLINDAVEFKDMWTDEIH